MKCNIIRWSLGLLRTLFVGIFVFAVGSCTPLRGAGVTIITHGFQTWPGDQEHSWVKAMSNSIKDITGPDTAVFLMNITRLNPGNILDSTLYVSKFYFEPGGRTPIFPLNPKSEVVIMLYWDEIADSFINADINTKKVAQTAVSFLFDQNKTGLSKSLFEMPIHFIGHSRGATLVSWMSKLLGENGIWVDQVTMLDPHPVTSIFDASPLIYENVLYADNYYEDESSTVPAGQKVPKAYNRRLNGYLAGGYGDYDPFSVKSRTYDHSDVHLWYHGTINTDTTASDGDAQFNLAMRSLWYARANDTDYNPDERRGLEAGYHYSRIGGHLWDGFIAGYFNGQNFNLGNKTPSNREALDHTQNPQWPNVISLARSDVSTSTAGGALNLTYTYQTYSNNATVSIYLSTDQNPYGPNVIQVPVNTTSYAPTQLGTPTVSVAGIIPPSAEVGKNYYMFAQITATNKLTRYTYAPGTINISPSTSAGLQAPVNLAAAALSSSAVALAWKNNPGNETAIRVEQQDASTGNWSVVAPNLPASATAYTHNTPLIPGTSYSYRVAAFNAASSVGVNSNTAVATTAGLSVVTRSLTVQSINPSSGISVLVDPVDRNGANDGYTPFTRVYNSSSSVFLSVPATTTGGKLFQKWLRAGADYSTSPSITVIADADYVFSAVYTDPPAGGNPGGVVVAPVISPPGGPFTDAVTVSLTCTTSDALLRYTTDGTQPTIYSPAYTGPFSVTQATTVTATAFKPNTTFSATSAASFTISYSQALPTPSIGPNGGTFTNPLNVGIVCGFPNAEVYYTFDGSVPQRSSNTILSPVTLFVNQTTTIKARAFKDGMNPSAVATASFTITNPQNNDNFANRIRISGPENSIAGSNVSATSESGEPRIYMNDKAEPTYWPPNHSVWWVWRAPYSGSVTFDTSGALGSWNGPSNFDTRLGVFTGSVVAGLASIGGDDDSGYGGFCSKFTFNATAGTDYNIVVDGWGSVTGRIELYWKMTTSPPPLPPYTPISLGPPDRGTGIRHRAVLYSLAFKDFNAGDTHAASQWIVTRNSDSVVVFDSGEDFNNKESIQLPQPLASTTSYSFIVRHKDSSGLWSDYSSPTSFTTRAPDPVTVNIVSPAQNASVVGAATDISGSASGSFGITEVRWTTDTGLTETVSVGANWTASQISIHPNQNTLTISVKDDDGNIGTTSVQFNASVPDTTKPSLEVSFPTDGTEFSTSVASTYLTGSATDAGGVSSISWTSDRGGSGAVSGNQNWLIGPIALLIGDNLLTVRATDNAGNFTEKALMFHVITPSSSRIVSVGGNLAFGNVTVGSSLTATMTIFNSGNSALTVNNINYPSGFDGSWSSGAIGSGNSQNVTVTFSPSAAISYGGIVTVNSDSTGGVNNTTASGTGLVGSFQVTPSAGANGSISPNTVQTVNSGGGVAFTATPNTGYAVNRWLVNGTPMQTGGTGYTASNITANATVQVTFGIVPYTVSPSAGANGSISPSTAQTVNYGGSVGFTATPSAGYLVDQWFVNSAVAQTGGVAFTATNVTGNTAVQVTFKPIPQYTVTPSAGTNGSISPSGVQAVNSGSNVSFNATPSTGYLVNQWLVNSVVAQTGGTGFTVGNVAGNTTVQVTFVAIPQYTVTPSAGANGTISPSTVQTVFSGSSAAFTATPSLGYRVDQWLVNGTPVQTGGVSYTVLNVTATVALQVTFKAGVSRDFNSDGNADFLCQNAIGQITAWHMNGAGVRSDWSWISTGPLGDWKVVGTGDFNNDGITDILCQNSIGQITAWYMDGAGNRTSWAYLSSGPLGDWRVVGTGDFNNDGNTDILCQNSIGQITAWYMNGAGVRTSWAYLSSGPLGDWRVVGTGDFNNDGNTDILCQNSIGQITAWYMNGAGVRTSWAYISSGPLADWRVVGTGDYNNDGNTDILCQNSIGQINVWYMNGAGVRSSWAWISTGPLGDWRVR